MPKTNVSTIDESTLVSARLKLQNAARLLLRIQNDPEDKDDDNKARMNAAIAEAEAAVNQLKLHHKVLGS